MMCRTASLAVPESASSGGKSGLASPSWLDSESFDGSFSITSKPGKDSSRIAWLEEAGQSHMSGNLAVGYFENGGCPLPDIGLGIVLENADKLLSLFIGEDYPSDHHYLPAPPIGCPAMRNCYYHPTTPNYLFNIHHGAS